MSSLEHHGIKGQKWGVRRFQNPDGTRTALGKKQLKAIRLSRNEEGIRQVYRSLSDRDLNLLGYEKEEIEANRKDDFKDLGRRHTDYDQYNRVRYKNGDAVGYIAATGYQTAVGRGKKIVNILAIDLAVNSNYRGQGHSVELGKDIVRWFDRYGSKEYDRMEWYAKAENIASQKAAERSGFERRSKKEAAQGWVKYSYKGKKVKHSSIGGNMNYIYGNTLVLGDPLYLEHHGIKGQRWGLRRFQNSDGSLTDAGRKRYGIVSGAKKAASMVGAGAKKTFDAGKKAATAIKAHREKAAEEKKAKLKEKASKSRLGVLANKDLFTADEMRKLNERFKIEDEMKMASLKKGADIVSNIATIARGVRDVNSAVEEITGKTINPFKKSKNEADLRKAEAQAKKAEAAADKERSEADKAARDNTKDAESKAKQEKESAAKEKEAATEKKASDNANKEIDDIKADTAKKAADISSKYDSPKKDGPKGLPEHTPAPKAKENEELSRTIKDVASKLDSGRMVLGRDKQAESGASNTPKLPGPTIKDHFNANSPAFKQLSAAISAANANKSSNVKAPKAKNIDVPDEYKPGAKKPKSNEELSKSLNELTKMAAKNLDTAKDKKSDPSSTNSKILEKNKNTLESALGDVFNGRQNRSANKSKIELLDKKAKGTKDPKMRSKYLKDLANEITLLDEDDFKKYLNGTLFKHSALSSDELAHYGVLGMKWGKHIMAGKRLLPKLESSGGGGGGAPEEEDDEENKIDPNYSRDKNKLPGKKHLDKATEYANKAAADRAKAQAEEAKMHKAQAEAASLDRKVKGASFWNDSDGYFVSKQRPADKKRVKQLKAEAKEHRQASKRYASSAGSNAAKSGKEYKKWIKTPSGLYDNAMRHDFVVEDGTLYLEHHGIKGQRWGVRRFQNADGTLTDKGRKHYQKKLDREKRKQVSSDNLRGTLERQHGLAVGASGIISAITGALTVAAVASNPATIAAGAAVAAAVSAGITHGSYSIAEAWEGRGSRIRKKKIAKYEDMLKQDAFIVEDGTLYLEHFGIKNMKWGVRRFQNKDGSLTEAGKKRYGSGEELSSGGGGGGGAPEEDEEMKKKIEEAAKKAGMTVDEYRKKFADKISAMKKKDTSWKYDASISPKGMRRMAKENSEFTESVSKKAHEAAIAQNSALRVGDKKRAKTHGWAATQYNTLARGDQTGDRYSVKNAKRNYDSTLEGKATKLKYATQRAKQRVYNAAGGEYKRQANLGRVYLKREKAKENRAIKRGNAYDAEAARSWQDLYRKSTNEMERAYENSLAGRYDKLKATMAERGKAKKNGTNEPRTHVLPKMKSATATAKPMRKLTSKELSKIRSEARVKQLKKDGDYTGEYKKKRRK